jgi:hypothetical protein
MRDREETFVLTPSQVFQQDLVDRRIDFLVERLVSLEKKIDNMSKILIEILRKLEPAEDVLEAKIQKIYGFEPKTEID